MTSRIFVVAGAIAAALAVALGAFGAHALKARLAPELAAVYQTAVQYHFYHAFGLILVGFAAVHWPGSPWLKWAGALMLAGIVLFSGSLYLLSVTGVRALGAVTPFGGAAFIAAWAAFALAAVRSA
jgi:uncharacterized membrane protein YgdD (TMEM256/DUF423 family)